MLVKNVKLWIPYIDNYEIIYIFTKKNLASNEISLFYVDNGTTWYDEIFEINPNEKYPYRRIGLKQVLPIVFELEWKHDPNLY